MKFVSSHQVTCIHANRPTKIPSKRPSKTFLKNNIASTPHDTHRSYSHLDTDRLRDWVKNETSVHSPHHLPLPTYRQNGSFIEAIIDVLKIDLNNLLVALYLWMYLLSIFRASWVHATQGTCSTFKTRNYQEKRRPNSASGVRLSECEGREPPACRARARGFPAVLKQRCVWEAVDDCAVGQILGKTPGFRKGSLE